jgi:hypothetical protein
MEKVNHIIENIEPPTGRFEHIRGKNGVLAIVDYAHTPDALEKVLETIREIKTEGTRIISVFGCGGDRDSSKRSKMGSIGASMSDIAIFTSDNPRNEDPDYIIAQMKTGLSEDLLNQVITIPDRIEATRVFRGSDTNFSDAKEKVYAKALKEATGAIAELKKEIEAMQQKKTVAPSVDNPSPSPLLQSPSPAA